jgi:hypothetical protein
MLFCNGDNSSKIYQLTDITGKDDLTPFTSSYCSYGFVNPEKAKELPQLGLFNKRFVLGDALISGMGTANVVCYQNNLDAPYPFNVPGGITLTSDEADIEFNLDERSQRFFVDFIQTNGTFKLSRLSLVLGQDKWSPISGVTRLSI